MKKTILLIICGLCLSGCWDKKIADPNADRKKYEAYYQSILDNETFLEKSENFSIEAVMNKVDDYYRFSVIIDNPKIAMYSVETMAIIDDGSVSINYEVVMPASGIFDKAYNLLPYQQNEAAGFAGGLILDGVCDKPEVVLLVMVSWRNEKNTVIYKEFFELVAKLPTVTITP